MDYDREDMTVALRNSGRPAIPQLGGFSFLTLEVGTDRAVKVFVTAEAAHDIEPGRMATFESHLESWLNIAEQKFDKGEIDQRDEIRITKADLHLR